MNYTILAINPGSTSTKIAIYEDETERYCETINHSNEELAAFQNIADQFRFRTEIVISHLKKNNFDINKINGIVGRGGLLPPVHAGGYIVNQRMKDRIMLGPILAHASNLGALIADAIAMPLGIQAWVYDSVASDELREIARITGFPEISRHSFCHVLNSKAIARKVAANYGKDYIDMNFIVAHLGGGISISAHEKGRIVDSITDDGGPFSPERSGSIPLSYVVDMCFSGSYDKKAIYNKLRGLGGLKAHLGTHDCREIEKWIERGDMKAKAVYEAMAYQVCKGIGEMSPTIDGKIDAIILTGGVAYSKMLTSLISDRITFLAPVIIMPGEKEMESLALGALRILRGEERPREYTEEKL